LLLQSARAVAADDAISHRKARPGRASAQRRRHQASDRISRTLPQVERKRSGATAMRTTRPPGFSLNPELTEEQRSLAASYEIAKQQNAKNLDKAVMMIELRKWCVEKAVEVMVSDGKFVVSLANEILAFVSAPIQE
jgi:hypothetical protein